MDPLATWEKILLGVFAVVILLWFFPGAKRSMENAPKATSQDWRALIVPLVLVVLFVLFLISMV